MSLLLTALAAAALAGPAPTPIGRPPARLARLGSGWWPGGHLGRGLTLSSLRLPGQTPLAVLKDRAGVRQAEFGEAVLGKMLESPTARRRALKVIALGAPALLDFERLEGEWIGEGDQAALAGALGYSDGGSAVVLNEMLLEGRPDRAVLEAAPVAAHELLGHHLAHSAARLARVQETFQHHRDDEAVARLTEAVVGAELGQPVKDEFVARYLEDPENAHADLGTIDISYALTFSDDELRTPLPALKRRLTETGRAAARADEDRAESLALQRFADRLILEGRVPPEALDAAKRELAMRLRISLYNLKIHERVLGDLSGIVADAERDDRQWRGLSRDLTHPFFQQVAYVRDALTARLRALRPVLRPLIEFSEPGPGQMSVRELKRLYRESR